MKFSARTFCWLALIGLSLSASAPAFAEENAYLHRIPYVRAILFDPEDKETFLIATGRGVLAVAPDGLTKRISANAGVFTELVQNPKQPRTYYASGYRSKSDKLGVLRSDDGGKTWSRITPGAAEPVAFRSIAVSHSDPAIIYGAEVDLQVSRDGGASWTIVGNFPGQIFDLAVSPTDSSILYAATRQALFKSADGGQSWTQAHPEKRSATMVHVSSGGKVYAFLYGLGLFVAEAPAMKWTLISDRFAGRALFNLAIDPSIPKHMLAVADTGTVVVSWDAGRTWTSFEGQLTATPKRIAAGRKLFAENCQACHGASGIGERPDNIYAKDEDGLTVAPPLDDSAHAWHHADDQLVGMILNGSQRNQRMAAWKEHGLGEVDARNLVAYIKSLWNFRSLACQGARHMRCMR